MDNKKSNGQNYSDDVAMVIRVKKDLYKGNTYYAAECCTPDGISWGISTDLQVLSYEKDHYIIDYPPLYVPDGYINILHALTSAIDAAGYTGQWTYRPLERALQEEIEKFGNTKKKIISLYTDSRECSNTLLDAKNEKLKEFAESQYAYLNLLLVGCLKRYGVMCRTVEEVIAELGKALEAYYE